jgi:hypothetical protein
MGTKDRDATCPRHFGIATEHVKQMEQEFDSINVKAIDKVLKKVQDAGNE